MNHTNPYSFDVTEAAQYMRCSRDYIYRLTAGKKIAHTKAGKTILFTQADLDAFLAARRVEPEARA